MFKSITTEYCALKQPSLQYCMPIHLTLYFGCPIFSIAVEKLSDHCTRLASTVNVMAFLASDLSYTSELDKVIEMSALWIAGLAILFLAGLFFALVLCRCAVLADKDVEQYLVDKDLSRTIATDRSGNREEPAMGQSDDLSPILSPPRPLPD
jgi:hypothetical protein